MKKRLFLLLSSFFLFVSVWAQQGNADFNTLNVRQNFGPPIADTIATPYKIGELRTRPQDNLWYRYNGKAIGNQRWDFVYFGSSRTIIPTLDQVLTMGNVSSQGITAGPSTFGGLKVPTLGISGQISMVVVAPDGTFSVQTVPGGGAGVSSINALTASAQFLKTSFTNATSPQWIDNVATHTINFPIAGSNSGADTGVVTPAQVVTWNGKYNLPGSGTTLQYIDGTGSLHTFPTIPDTGRFTVVGAGLIIAGNPKWPDLKFTISGGSGASAISGDATGTISGSTIPITINANVVTYAKIQQVAANRIWGNPTGSLANGSEIPLGRGLIFGAGSILVDSGQYTTNKKLTDSLALRDTVFTSLPLYTKHGAKDTVAAKNDSAAWNAKAIFGVPVDMTALANNFVLTYNTAGSKIVWGAQSGGSGTTNITVNRGATSVAINSSTGSPGTFDTATASLAGAMSVWDFTSLHHPIKLRNGYFTPGFSDSLVYAINDTAFWKGEFAGPGIKHTVTKDSIITYVDTNYIKLYAAKPAGANGAVQFNNGGVFGALTALYDGSKVVFPNQSTESNIKFGIMELQGLSSSEGIIGYNTFNNGTNFVYRATGQSAYLDFGNASWSFINGQSGTAAGTVGNVKTLAYYYSTRNLVFQDGVDANTAANIMYGTASIPAIQLALQNGTNWTKMGTGNTGIFTILSNSGVSISAGLFNYDVNRGSTYTVRSFTDKNYVDSAIAKNVSLVGGYIFQQSLVNNSGTVNLVGDVTSPGNSFYYGTNVSGTKGFFVLPTITTPGIDAVIAANNVISTPRTINLNGQSLTMFNGTFAVQNPNQSKISYLTAAGGPGWSSGRSVNNANDQTYYIKDDVAALTRLTIDGSGKTTLVGLQVADGTQGAGKVMISDASGNTTWQTLPGATTPTLQQVISVSALLNQVNTITTASNQLIFNEGTSNIAITGSNQSILAFTNAAGTNSYSIGRSPANDNAQAFFIRDITNSINPLVINNFGITALLGLSTSNFTFTDGNQGVGKVLTSNVSGIANWSDNRLNTAGIGVTATSSNGQATINSITISGADGYSTGGTGKHLIINGSANITVASTSQVVVHISLPSGLASTVSNAFTGGIGTFNNPGTLVEVPMQGSFTGSTTNIDFQMVLPTGNQTIAFWTVMIDYR